MDNDTTRRDFLKIIGTATLTLGTASFLSGCNRENFDDIVDEKTDEYYTETDDVMYFDVGEHLISTSNYDMRNTQNYYVSNKQVDIIDGYELVSSSFFMRGSLIFEKMYWINTVPVSAKVYIDKDDNLVCPYPGSVEYTDSNSYQKIK